MVVRERPDPRNVVRAAEPTFLVFVLGLGVIVGAASEHGLSTAVDALLPHGTALPTLLLVAVVSAAVANLLNNLPGTLIILPVVAHSGSGGRAGHASRSQRRS
jgi:arsenical pump membrane protein